MYSVLVAFSKVSAPITPFISEGIYTNLTKEESVHLSTWPKIEELNDEDKKMIVEMQDARLIVEIGHSLRKEANIPVRQPLLSLSTVHDSLSTEMADLILDELNIKKVIFGSKKNILDLEITPELKEEADTRDLIRKIQAARKELSVEMNAKINLTSDWLPKNKDLKEWLIKKTLVEKITEGEFGVSLVNAEV